MNVFGIGFDSAVGRSANIDLVPVFGQLAALEVIRKNYFRGAGLNAVARNVQQG